jgi:hypothetical protein
VFNVTPCKIDAADRAIHGVSSIRRTRAIKLRVENIFAMLSRQQAIVNDEGHNDVARVSFAIGDIFTPSAEPFTVTADARSR